MIDTVQKKNILFAIKSVKPSGGALKVRHYYEHAMCFDGLNTLLYMPDDIDWETSNPWYQYRGDALTEIDWRDIDIVFISGWGWERFIPNKHHYKSHFKVIYLVQHPSKLMPEFNRYQNLDKPAVRICVSGAMTAMARKIEHINGTVVTIPAGTDLNELSAIANTFKTTDILISGLKNPTMGQSLQSRLKQTGMKIKLLDKRIDRNSFIEFVSASKIVVCLPNPLEGFYLPALEAMAMGALVICPDAIGNDYCRDTINCLIPEYTEEAILKSIQHMWSLSENEKITMKRHAESTVKAHDIVFEKEKFHQLLSNIASD